MKRYWFLMKEKVIPVHKKLTKILEELKIYCETIVMILIAIVTIKVSLAANTISEKQTELAQRQTVLTERQTILAEKQTELTERQTILAEQQAELAERQMILAEKQYKNEYLPRLIIKEVDENPSIIAENILYELDINFLEAASSGLDLFLDFDNSVFDREELYQLLLKSDTVGSIFLANGLTYFDPNINIDQFKDVILNLDDRDKKILNQEFNELFYYSGDQYVLENIGDKVVNGSIQYEINISIHILSSSGYNDSYNVLLKDTGYPYYELKENIIIIQCLNPILIQYMVDDFESYLKEKLNNENIYISYNDCICMEYDDNEDFVSEHYHIYDEELEPFYNDDYYENCTIYENIDREEILLYIKEQMILKKK